MIELIMLKKNIKILIILLYYYPLRYRNVALLYKLI